MNQRFSGRAIVVTGAAGGIGLAAATQFAAEGGRVLMADLDGTRVQAAADALAKAGAEVHACRMDVGDHSSCEAMVARAVELFGAVHVAFNNAAVPSSMNHAFEDAPIDEWTRVLSTNLTGVYYCMRAEVRAMKRSGGGVIINTASMMSLVAAPRMASYIASKHGVVGLTKAAASELAAFGIRVNAIAPGFTRTPMLEPILGAAGAEEYLAGRTPSGRLGEPAEPAAAVLFLASEEARYIVGAVLPVDGGATLL